MNNLISYHYMATFCFFMALVHTFSVKKFQTLALKYKEGSVQENLFHLLGEVEIVFGVWAFIFVSYIAISTDASYAIQFLEEQNFTEPAFVFVIMTVCSTKPILEFSEKLIELLSKIIPLKKEIAFYISCLVFGPLLGSFITEPAAMTVTALILLNRYYNKDVSLKFKYATLGLLFVNVSIGGTLTPFAAPPVLMVAAKWSWDLRFMLLNFGWKAFVAIVLSTKIVAFKFRKELLLINNKSEHFSDKNKLPKNEEINSENSNKNSQIKTPIWVVLLHIVMLFSIISTSHHVIVFISLFLFFLGLVSVTKEYQSEIKLKEGLLVGFFLGGLVVLGGPQRWWLEPILSKLEVLPMFLGSLSLTAITDNAALTYLGSQVPNLSDAAKYALVSGSVVGGGLTVIANAPNPAGYGILNSSFGESGISAFSLFKSALVPTGIAAICFWFL